MTSSKNPMAPSKTLVPPSAGAGNAPGLTLAVIEQQAGFYNARVKHPAMTRVLDDLLPLLLPHSETNIVIVTGATGVGKSTLTRNLLSVLVKDFAPVAASDESAIPLVAVEAYANGEARHGFKGLYEEIAESLQEPGLDRKNPAYEADGRLFGKPQSRATTAALRKVVENALRFRKTRVLVIDEAAHLLRFGREMAPMDTLKSLANTAGVKLVLVGSYDLLDLVTSHGQIARRTAVLCFERYQMNRASDRAEFRGALAHLMTKWPCGDVPNLLAISDHLLEASMGCIGLLKSLLLDASAMQLRNKGVWDPQFLLKAAKSSALHRVIRQEIEVGEQKVKEALVGQAIWNTEVFNTMKEAMAS